MHLKEKFTILKYCYAARSRKQFSLEIHLADHCNYSCKGCCHFSPIAERWFLTPEEIEWQLKLLSERAPGFDYQIRLLGGEPLLNPDIAQILDIVRKYFPASDVAIISNGSLIYKMNEAFWDAMTRNKISMLVSQYPVDIDYEQLKDYVRMRNVDIQTAAVRDSFFQFRLNTKGKHPWFYNYLICRIGCKSNQLWHGKIYSCPQSAYISFLNRKFGTDFQHTKGDFIALEDIRSERDLKHFRLRPKRICRYCNIDLKQVAWGTSKKQACEWIDE